MMDYSKTNKKNKKMLNSGNIIWCAILALSVNFSLMACEPIDSSRNNDLTVAAVSVKTQENITDQEITSAVELEFIGQDGIRSYLIDVSTQEGIVSLTGETNNILAKECAANIAQMIKGVRGVVNNIKVKDLGIEDALLRACRKRTLYPTHLNF